MTTTIAWLLTDGGVEPLVGVRRIFWPGQAEVTFKDGTKSIEPVANVLSSHDLGVRFFDQKQEVTA